MSRALVWFRCDLRTADHAALSACADAKRLLPVYIYPQRFFEATPFGFAKTGAFRAAFLIESVNQLREALRIAGSDLVVCQGDPAVIIPRLMELHDLSELWYQDEPGTEEAEEAEAVESGIRRTGAAGSGADRGPSIYRCKTRTLYHPDDIPFPEQSIPDVYSDFRRGVEKRGKVRMPLSAPTRLPPPPAEMGDIRRSLEAEFGAQGSIFRAGDPTVEQLSGQELPDPDARAAVSFIGGERAALRRLQHYIWDSDSLKRYKQTRNGLLGADYSSKLSPWLANGSLSPRTVYREIRRYERERVKNDSTYWLVFELIWRDYFSFLTRKYPRRIFSRSGPMRRGFYWKDDWEKFRRWCHGQTGQQFIDANMREIAATGFMSNRGRQNVASYLARNLEVNWLMGAEYFESILVDYDPASNYGNWTYTVGVGTDPRLDRTFNPDRQAERYDPEGRYQLHWLGAASMEG
jgi:deoxyribodipyrimidine photo-lyase